jgi:hypothetical protein
LPVVPQLAAPWSRQEPAGSGIPAGTSTQVPSVPTSAQDWQAPAQAVAQQTPCAQLPDWHSDLFEQNAPPGFGPHELPLHTVPAEQLPLTVQPVKQRAPLHTYGTQEMASDALQVPLASQVEGGV